MAPSLRALADAGELGLLEQALRHRRPSEAGLAGLLRHSSGRVVQLTLGWLLAEIPRTADPDLLSDWAKLLPPHLAPGWPPEVHGPLADAVVELAPWGARLPDWRAWDLPPALALPWLRASLQVAPDLAAEGATERLLHALATLKGGRCLQPTALVDGLLALGDARFLAPALRLLQEAARAGAMPPNAVGPRLKTLVESGLLEALTALAGPWARSVPVPRTAVVAALKDPSRAAAAVALLTARGEGDLLLGVARGDLPGPRTAALAALGDHVERAEALLEVAEDDPLAFGPAVRQALVAAHRRGVFVRPGDVPRLLMLFLVHRGWPPIELAELCHPARDALVEVVSRFEPADPAWPRLLPVLAASEAAGARAVVRSLLARRSPPATERAAIEAVAAAADAEGESLVVDALPRHPPEALAALRIIGGAVTVRSLRGFLGIEPPGEVAPWLLTYLEAAVTLLWQLSPPRSTGREELLGRLNPGELPRLITADVANERSGAARRLALNAALYLGPDQALIRLCALGEEGTWDTLYGLLRRTVVGLHDGSVAGDAPLGTEHTRGRPRIPEAVVEALLGHGRLLVERGRIRPACLVRGGEPGQAFFAEIALDLAIWGGLEPPMQHCLLVALETVRAPGLVRRVHPLLRHKDPEVRAAAVRILVAQDAEDPRGDRRESPRALSFSLTRLLREDDPVTLRPALEAVARFGLRGATSLVAACLEHPNMNIKKTAAEALARLDAAAVVDRLVFWLGRHDNPGFRALLNQAYDAARVGPAPLVVAVAAAEDAWTVELLLQALDGRLTAVHLRRLIMGNHPAGETLLAAVAAGRLRLQEGDLAILRVELRRYALPAADRLPPPPQVRPGPVEALERRGFDAQAARDALADPACQPFVAGLVRRSPREWLALLPELDAPQRRRLAPALGHLDDLDAARDALEPLLSLLSEIAHDSNDIEGLVRLLVRVGAERPGALAGRVTDALRGLPPIASGDGLVRWHALGRLGAVPQRADLEATLRDCERTPNPPGNAQALLCLAFQVQNPAPRVPPALLAAVQSAETAPLAELGEAPLRDMGARLAAIIAAWPHAVGARRAELLDLALRLQPLGTERWNKSALPPPPRPKVQLEGSLRREALLGDLAGSDPAKRREAAVALLDWPDVPEAHHAVLEAWLAGRVEVPVDRQWALAELLVQRPDLLDGPRAVEAVEWLPLTRRRLLADRLWSLWEAGVPKAGDRLRGLGAAFLLPDVAAAVAEGRLTAVELLTQGPLPRSPLLDRMVAALRAGGQGRLADELLHRARPGPLGTPDPPETPAPAAEPGPGHEALVAAARGPDGAAARAALDQLMQTPGPELVDLLVELTTHRDPARRILALRSLKRAADRATYLEAALPFLDDPRPDVQRSVIRTLAHARHPAALKPIAELIDHRQRVVREAASEAIELYGPDALPVLKQLLRRARPDRRGQWLSLIEHIEGGPLGRGDPSRPPRAVR